MDNAMLREWALSLNNIPACWPLRDAILRLLRDKTGQGSGPEFEYQTISAATATLIRIWRTVNKLEKERDAEKKEVEGLKASLARLEEAAGALSLKHQAELAELRAANAAAKADLQTHREEQTGWEKDRFREIKQLQETVAQIRLFLFSPPAKKKPVNKKPTKKPRAK